MLLLAGAAAGGIIDLVSSLKQSDFAKHKADAAESVFGLSASQPVAADTSDASTSTASALSPDTLRMLLWLQAHGLDVSSDIFAKLDADGSGGISESEFEEIFARNGDTARADAVFARLDDDGDGTISSQEFSDGLRAGRHRHGPPEQAASQASGDSSRTVSNADGSTTTTITYADGSQVTMTRPAAGSDGAAANLLERLIQRQAEMLTRTSSGQSLATAA